MAITLDVDKEWRKIWLMFLQSFSFPNNNTASTSEPRRAAEETMREIAQHQLLETARSFAFWKQKIVEGLMKGERFEEIAKHAVDTITKYYYTKLKQADQSELYSEIFKLVTCAIEPDFEVYKAFQENEKKVKEMKKELAEKFKELKIHRKRKDSGVVELEEKLEMAEKAKLKKNQEIEHINKKLRNCQNEVSQLENLVKGLKQEKTKKEAGLVGFGKRKKELVKAKEELKRMEGIANSDKSTIQKLINENRELQKQLASQHTDYSNIQVELKRANDLIKFSCEEAEENPPSMSEAQKLALKRYELHKLQKTLTSFTIRAEKETVLEAFENDGGASKNAIKKARMQLEEHFKASEQAAKVVKENLKLIENHLNFTVDSLAIVPFVPPPFTDEMSRMKEFQYTVDDLNNFEVGYEESCGLCSKALKGSKTGLVACNTCNLYWHYQELDTARSTPSEVASNVAFIT